MPVVSKEKKDKISEQILHHLFTLSPESRFTSEIAKEIARDEEFTKSLLLDLSRKKMIVEVNKNKAGVQYVKRQRWRLTNQVFEAYKKHQVAQISQFSSQLQQSL
jgi:predicted transcriptional regulator with HTH domain